MGFDVNGVKCLVTAKGRGVNFERVVTLGRQELRLDGAELMRSLRAGGISLGGRAGRDLLEGADGYAEPLLRLLGATEVTTIDASQYENASLIHDLNRPIDDNLKGRFTVVIDGGSLEHVFHFPTNPICQSAECGCPGEMPGCVCATTHS